ncbi:hypothetical protein D3C71_367470 [compost metagenome]
MPNAKPMSRMLGLTLGKEMTGGCAIKSSCLFMRRATEKPPHGSAAPVFEKRTQFGPMLQPIPSRRSLREGGIHSGRASEAGLNAGKDEIGKE